MNELAHTRSGDTLRNAQSGLPSGLYRVLIPAGTHLWRTGVQTYLSDEPASALASFDAPPAAPDEPCGPDTRDTLARLWAGATLAFESPARSGTLMLSQPESTSDFRADRDRWLYLQLNFPAGKALGWQSQIDLHADAAPAPAPVSTKIKALMVGDSVMYGYLDSLPSKRLPDHPQLVLNREQQVFDFCYNYATPGASFTGVLSSNAGVRTANGMPGGCTLGQLLAQTDAQAALFNLGGNDYPNRAQLADNVKAAAAACQAVGKLFAFVGVIDINAMSSYAYAPAGTSFYTSGYLEVAAEIAAAAEIVRQTCRAEGYAYVDLRSGVLPEPWASITGDVIHPTQAYSTAIFTHVAKAIAG